MSFCLYNSAYLQSYLYVYNKDKGAQTPRQEDVQGSDSEVQRIINLGIRRGGRRAASFVFRLLHPRGMSLMYALARRLNNITNLHVIFIS